MSGKRGRCAKCHQPFTVPKVRQRPVPLEEMPQYIGVDCRLCGTRMYGGPDQIGKELKCPDCGARTVLPPPPKPKPKNIPEAMFGEQYELWEPDEAPLPTALVAQQPSLIAVKCRRCDTLMYATAQQVGQQMSCPDCGMKHVVPAPPREKPKPSVLVPDEQMPVLDASASPGERPPVMIPPRHKMEYEEQQETEYARALEEARRSGRPMRVDHRGRPIMPRQPLLTGVWPMLLTEEVIARWVLLSVVLGFAGQFLSEALLTPIQGVLEVYKLFLVVMGILSAAAWLAMAAPLMVAIVGHSADGQDRLHQVPRLLAFDWFSELFSVFFAGSLAGLCGLAAWYLVRWVTWSPVVSVVVVVMVVVLVFPFALLSTLLEGTPLGVVSPRLVSSLWRCKGGWLLFYAQTVALAAVVGSAAWLLARSIRLDASGAATFLWFLGPLVIAALLLEMRLLGRLAWWIRERVPEREVEEEKGP